MMRFLGRFRNRRKAKVFGIGTIKTGTTSLGAALEMLGYRNTHHRRDYLLRCLRQGNWGPIHDYADWHESFEDWPWPLIFREMDRRYPNSKFILTRRSGHRRWLNSVKRHAEIHGPTIGRRMFFGHGTPEGHEGAYLDSYHRHLAAVRHYFRDRPGKLLEVCWEEGDGWPELCAFLNRPAPPATFPVLNTAGARVAK